MGTLPAPRSLRQDHHNSRHDGRVPEVPPGAGGDDGPPGVQVPSVESLYTELSPGHSFSGACLSPVYNISPPLL